MRGGALAGASNGHSGKPAFAAAAPRAAPGPRQGPKNSRTRVPATRLDSPSSRIWASVSCSARSNTRRQAAGFRNGSRPSRINTSASALARISSPISVLLRGGRVARARARPDAAGAAHDLEEVAVRIHHHHVRPVAEAGAVGLEVAVELGEL